MIIFLYGQDDYRRTEKKKSVIEEFQKKHSVFGIGSFDLSSDENMPQFHDFVRSQSIFDPARLTIVENAFESANKEALAKELKELAKAPKTTVLLSEREKPAKTLQFLLKPPALSQSFDILRGKEWESFVKEEARKRGVKLAESALSFFAAAYGGDSWRLVTELEKMRWIQKSIIEKEDLECLGLEIAPNFWNLLYGLREPDISQRTALLERVFAENEPPAKIFNILAAGWQEKVPAMARYDLAIKSGKLEYEEALVDLILS